MADRIIFILTVILAVVYLYATEQFPSLEIGDPLGPKAFPRLLGIGLLMTAAGLLAAILRAPKTGAGGSERKDSGGHRHYPVVLAAVVWTGLYLAVFIRPGYAIATTVYLLALMACFHRGKWMTNLLTSVLFGFIELPDVHQTSGCLAAAGHPAVLKETSPWKL